MGQDERTSGPFDFATKLSAEIREQTDPKKSLPFLYALFRVLDADPERRDEADALLEQMREIEPSSPDIVWEAWRASVRQGPSAQLSALTALSGLLEFPQDILHAHLFSAELLSEQSDQSARAEKELDALRKIAHDQLEVRLASARVRAFSGALSPDGIKDLEAFAERLEDRRLQAALFFEIAELLRNEGAPRERVSRLLHRALSAGIDDWSLADGVLRVAEKIEDFSVVEAAVRKTADAAVEPEPEPDADKPFGHSYRGFERNEEVGGAWYWYLAQILEQRCKDIDGAIVTLERAQALLPKSRLLKSERARLLSAAGRYEDAFDAFPEDSGFSELALFALAAKKNDEAAYLASLERESNPSLFAEVLAESLCDDVPAPPAAATPTLLQYWFDTYPNHDDAQRVAAALRNSTAPPSTAALYLEENASAQLSIAESLKKRDPEPWVHALDAVLGEAENRPDAFRRWAESTTDPILRRIFQETATRLENPSTVDAAAPPPEVADRWWEDGTFDNSQESWQRLSSRLAQEEAENAPPEKRRSNQFLRALIHFGPLGDPKGAQELLPSAEEGSDDALLFHLMRLHIACREKNIPDAATCTEALLTQAPEDRPSLLLTAGELHLLAGESLGAALRCFDEAAKNNNQNGGVAHIYRLLTLHLLREQEAIERALEESSASTQPELENFLAFDRPSDSGFKAATLLEGAAEIPVYKALSRVLTAIDSDASLSNAADGLRTLATLLPAEENADAYRIAAALLDGRTTDLPQGTIEGDPDLLIARQIEPPPTSPSEAAAFWPAHAERVRTQDLYEWVDRMLAAADADAAAHGPDVALTRIHEALNEAPDHPGLLEAEVRLATAAGEFEEAADTRGRLARFYVSQDEKVHQLSQAALILFDRLQNPEGAANILREARRRNPGHAEANDVMRYIEGAVGLQKSSAPAAGPAEETEE